jgi:hypothetical protein
LPAALFLWQTLTVGRCSAGSGSRTSNRSPEAKPNAVSKFERISPRSARF